MDHLGNWDKTIRVNERLKDSSYYEEPAGESIYGKWQGRDIIGRDSRINGGVYVGGGTREAIVVDDKTQTHLIDVYEKLLDRVERRTQDGVSFKKGILSDVFTIAREILPYNAKRVDEIIGALKSDQKIALAVFIKEKAGVCRHQALLCAYLLEKLKQEGKVDGTVSVDRNFIPNRGGHAWVRYVNSAGNVFIIDPAQGFIGKIEEVAHNAWFYERPKQ